MIQNSGEQLEGVGNLLHGVSERLMGRTSVAVRHQNARESLQERESLKRGPLESLPRRSGRLSLFLVPVTKKEEALRSGHIRCQEIGRKSAEESSPKGVLEAQ